MKHGALTASLQETAYEILVFDAFFLTKLTDSPLSEN